MRYIRLSMASKRMKKRKVIVTAVSGVLLMLLYLIIFSFSEQNGEQSGSLSQMISEKCAAFINALSGKHWSDAVLAGWAEYFEHPIRKLAHFTEYACMGVLVYVLWSQWLRQGKRLYVLTVLWVFLSALGDEIHQLFVPGRYGRIQAGACLACCFAFACTGCSDAAGRRKADAVRSFGSACPRIPSMA